MPIIKKWFASNKNDKALKLVVIMSSCNQEVSSSRFVIVGNKYLQY